MCIIPFSPRMIWASAFFHPHFTDNDMKAQVGLVTFPRLSQDLNPGFSDSKVHVLSTHISSSRRQCGRERGSETSLAR